MKLRDKKFGYAFKRAGLNEVTKRDNLYGDYDLSKNYYYLN